MKISIIAIVLLFLAIAALAASTIYCIATTSKENAEKRLMLEQEGIVIFGYLLNTNDFFSIIQTMAAYLMASDNKEVSLKYFVNEDLLRRPDANDYFIYIERAINELPVVACKHMGYGTYIIDEKKLAEKYKKYQEFTQRDDYIVPMFQADVVNRNPIFFNFPTRFQQAEVLKKLTNSELLRFLFHLSDKAIKRGEFEMERAMKDSEKYRIFAPIKESKQNYISEETEYEDEYETDESDEEIDYEEESINEDEYPGQISFADYT